MELEFLLLITLALFFLIAIGLTLATWDSIPSHRMNLAAETIRFSAGMGVNLTILWHTWADGSDFKTELGVFSLQALLLLFAIGLCLMHIYDMEKLNKLTRQAM